jgi:hypothetical protein
LGRVRQVGDEQPATTWSRTLEFSDDSADCIDGSAAYGAVVIWPRQGPLLFGGMAGIALLGGLALMLFARVERVPEGPLEMLALGAWGSLLIFLLTLLTINVSYKRAWRKALAERGETPKGSVRFEFGDEGYRVTTSTGVASVSWLAVTDVIQRPTGVYLMLGSACQCLPSRAFRDEADRATFTSEAITRVSEPARARSLRAMPTTMR